LRGPQRCGDSLLVDGRQSKKTQGHVRYYRKKLDAERSYTDTMEVKLNDLRRENDYLRRKVEHVAKSPLPSDNRPAHYEQSKDKVSDIQWRLDRMSYENERLEKESERLKERLKHLEDAQQIGPKVENISKDLQSRLDQAMSKNEELTGTLEKTHRHVQNLESEKTSLSTTISSLQMENESMQEEMEQMKMNHAMELGFAEGEESDASH